MANIKKTGLNILSFRKISRGWTEKEARRWTRRVYHNMLGRKGYSFGETMWAIKRGFMPNQVKWLELNEENYMDTISAKDYAYLRPLNGGYSKWLMDKITINSIFKPYRDHMPTHYYQIGERDGELQIIPLTEEYTGCELSDIIDLLKEKGSLRICLTNRVHRTFVDYKDGVFYIDDVASTEDDIKKVIKQHKSKGLVITSNIDIHEEFENTVLKLTIINEQGDNPQISDAYIKVRKDRDIFKRINNEKILKGEDFQDGDEESEEYEAVPKETIYAHIDAETGLIEKAVKISDGEKVEIDNNPETGKELPTAIPFWGEIKETVDSMCRFVPQLEFFGVDIVIGKDNFYMVRFLNHPSYPIIVPFSKSTSDYLKGKVVQKKDAFKSAKIRTQIGLKKIKLRVRANFAKLFFPKGLLPYLSVRWITDQFSEFTTNKDTTLKEKIWAAKNGFLSYRLRQYGITEENRTNFISDFEYKWLRHINPKYRYWMEDKITVKYICSQYNECFPEYYYHISLKNGNNKVISMMDCPKHLTNSFEDIFNLVKEKKVLALKPDEGSHGDGFYKFAYEDGQYFLNHEPATADDVMNILTNVNNQYLVTEYINMHSEIKKIYDGAVNTIRMIVFKKDGKTPVIGNAYMRFGSKKTGAVDNMGAGGMFAKIDIETGRFYDSKIMTENGIEECLHHPDTGVKIDGYLPNWEKVKELVLEVATGIPQLEYFGFDLALTEDGIKFPEINRFPDYPAIEKYTDKTIDYLLYKLEKKKEKFGYDKNRGNTLFKLPKR